MNCLYHHYFFLLSNVRTLFTRLLTVGYDSPWPLWAVRLRKEPVQYWHFFSRAIHGSSIDIKWCRFDVFLSKTTAILLASKCIIVIFVSFLLSILSIPFYDLKIIRTWNGGHEIYFEKTNMTMNWISSFPNVLMVPTIRDRLFLWYLMFLVEKKSSGTWWYADMAPDHNDAYLWLRFICFSLHFTLSDFSVVCHKNLVNQLDAINASDLTGGHFIPFRSHKIVPIESAVKMKNSKIFSLRISRRGIADFNCESSFILLFTFTTVK